MRAYTFFVNGPKFTTFTSQNVEGAVVDHLRFRGIRDQSLKLSEIAPNFGRLCPTKF